MARITMEKALAATGVGLIDLAGEKYLASKEFAGIKGSDALRFGVTAASFLVNYFDYEREISEAAFYASLPGVVKAVANMAGVTTAGATRVPVVVEKVAPPVAPAPAPVKAPTPTTGAPVPP
ncbi:MAG: hypothetical protein J7J61_04080 [Candidatus Hydrothermae bacterium]|nr:hypothetical protein [Candidatus Hydrothermae bacterium]